MRIALLSDVHGNSVALEAVLADVEAAGGTDEVWALGDLAAIGPDPVGSLERLAGLDNAHFTYGNTDRYVTSGDRPFPGPDDVRADPELLPRIVEVASNFSWTQGAITQAGWFEWLTELPLERRVELPDGSRLLGVHASPGEFDGSGIRDGHSVSELTRLLEGADAEVVVTGHTHQPFEATLGGVHAHVLAPVSVHMSGDLRAGWSLLEADGSGWRLERRYVEYDRRGVIEELRRLQHPGGEFIIRHLSER